LTKAIDMHCYVNVGLLTLGLALAFIAVCLHIGRVFLGAANSNTQFFKPVLTCVIPALLLAGSLFLGFTTGPALLNWLK